MLETQTILDQIIFVVWCAGSEGERRKIAGFSARMRGLTRKGGGGGLIGTFYYLICSYWSMITFGTTERFEGAEEWCGHGPVPSLSSI